MVFEHPSRSEMNLTPRLVFPSVMGRRHLLGQGVVTVLGGHAVTESEHCVISACLTHSQGAWGPSCGGKKNNRDPLGLGLETIASRSMQLYDWKGTGHGLAGLFLLKVSIFRSREAK